MVDSWEGGRVGGRENEKEADPKPIATLPKTVWKLHVMDPANDWLDHHEV